MISLSWLVMPWAAAMLVFLIAWVWGKSIRNYSIVDALWAATIGSVGITWLICGSNRTSIRFVLIALLGAWSTRLTHHLTTRIYRSHPKEDSRYQELRDQWSPHENRIFCGFFQIQGISAIILALPFYFVAFDTDGAWGGFESIGLTIAMMGILGESIADRQMAAFKRQDRDPKSICRSGLWKYSRHPNYFFESVIWWGFYLFACGSSWGWMTIHAPIIITFLLLKVTGIPPTEKGSLARKGDAYRRYQETTSAFIPLPPKQS